jgi:hypothetical protein
MKQRRECNATLAECNTRPPAVAIQVISQHHAVAGLSNVQTVRAACTSGQHKRHAECVVADSVAIHQPNHCNMAFSQRAHRLVPTCPSPSCPTTTTPPPPRPTTHTPPTHTRPPTSEAIKISYTHTHPPAPTPPSHPTHTRVHPHL